VPEVIAAAPVWSPRLNRQIREECAGFVALDDLWTFLNGVLDDLWTFVRYPE
jgi:hypothetical protein